MMKSSTRTPWTLTLSATPTSTATPQLSPCPWVGIHTLFLSPSDQPTTQRFQRNAATPTLASAQRHLSKHRARPHRHHPADGLTPALTACVPTTASFRRYYPLPYYVHIYISIYIYHYIISLSHLFPSTLARPARHRFRLRLGCQPIFLVEGMSCDGHRSQPTQGPTRLF